MPLTLNSNYEDITSEIISNGILEANKIYFFAGNVKKGLYEAYFRWSVSWLVENQMKSFISNPFIAFINIFEINAFALKYNMHQLIGINYGLVELLFDFFSDRESMFQKESYIEYKSVCNKIRNQPPFHFLYKNCTKFIFFHELGHLIQSNADISYHDELRLDIYQVKGLLIVR